MKLSKLFKVVAMVAVVLLLFTSILTVIGCTEDRDTSHYNYYRCPHCHGSGKTQSGASCGWCNGTGMYAVKKDGY